MATQSRAAPSDRNGKSAHGSRVQVAVEHVHPPPEQQEVYQGVSAPKRKRVDDQTDVGEMPKVCVHLQHVCACKPLLQLPAKQLMG